MSNPSQEFQGIRYYQSGRNPYYWRKFVDPSTGRKRSISMHVAVWTCHNGPVPAGMHVHHVDRDTANNAIENLELVSSSEHGRAHARARIAAGTLKPPSAEALAKAAAWHRSPAGKAWHAQHGPRTWDNAVKQTYQCVRCGKDYETFPRSRKRGFCSMYCQLKARNATGVDDETRSCEWCGKDFRCNRHIVKRTCSGSCGGKLAARNRYRSHSSSFSVSG